MSNQIINAENIRDVIRYLQKFKNAVIVIYLDDKTIQSPMYSSHIRDIALLHSIGLKVVIIPGARTRIDEILSSAKIDWKYKNNCRVTTEEAMPLIKMAAFDVSNMVMTSLAANNITATIGNWVRSRAKGVVNGFDFGTAGEIDKLQVDAIQSVLNNGFIPIFPCIGWNSVGHPYNISSISLAQKVAIELKADKLFFVMWNKHFNTKDFITNENLTLHENGDIAAMSVDDAQIFAQKNQSERDLISLAVQACKNGVTRVHIVDGQIDGVIPTEIFSNLGSGTMIFVNNYGKIRQMQQTDIPSVLSLIKPFVESGKLLPRSEEQLSQTFGDYIVYEIDGTIHACSALHFYDDGQAEIAAVAVEENFTKMGIGPKMIEYLIKLAKSKNAKSIFILTTQASDWFEKLGFVLGSVDSLPEKRKKIWSSDRNSKVFYLR